MNVQRYFKIAKKLSYKSNHKKYKLGCVIVRGKTIVGMGWNMQKTHPLSPHPYHYVHAEFMAILSAGQSRELLEGATCYVYRETKLGNWAMAKPCHICMSMLRSYGIHTVTYTVHGSYATEKVHTLLTN